MTPLLETRGLSRFFPVKRGLLQRTTGFVRAVDSVDLKLEEGEFFALVGESGSGKTTLGRTILRLIEPTAGTVLFKGRELNGLKGGELRRMRRHFQMIFQDPYGSLNPRMTVGKILSEPLEVHGTVARDRRAERVAELLDLVGLPRDAGSRYPHEFSGGQRQRVGIARALAPEPDLIVADEPVSALDVSVRAQVVNLLASLQDRLGLTVLFIAHDLAVVEQIAHRVGVMYLGRLVESAPTAQLFSHPQHPYTVSLLSSVPIADPAARRERILLPGEPPSPLDPPRGCSFHPRCPIGRPECRESPPALESYGEGHQVACLFAGEM